MNVVATCAQGHRAVVTDEAPQSCFWCGSPLMLDCPHGHRVTLGRATCPTCGAAMSGASVGPTKGRPVAASPPAGAAAPAAPTHADASARATWAPPTGPHITPQAQPDRPIDVSPTGQYMSPHALRFKRNSRLLALLVAGIVVLTVIGATVAAHVSTHAGATPEHPIYGKAITLPADLRTVQTPVDLIYFTPSDALNTIDTLWSLWQRALNDGDTRALTQLVAQPVLDSELYNCVWPSSGCGSNDEPNDGVTLTVPVQQGYPLYFLAQVNTEAWFGENNGNSHYGPYLQMLVVTKSTPSATWKIALATGFALADGKNPTPLAMGFTPGPLSPPPAGGLGYDPDPEAIGPISAGLYLPSLAAYWQSWKTTGHAPPHSVFVSDGDTSGFGQYLAETRQNDLNRYAFQVDPADGIWLFSDPQGEPIECGTIVDSTVNLAAPGQSLNQNSSRTNWGMQLAPGQYRSINTQTIHQTCVYPASQSKLDAAGTDGNAIAITGVPAG